jgi:hypothetical protein
MILEGQCREISVFVFIPKKLSLASVDMPKKDFEFRQIFVELLIFVIGSPMYSFTGS